MMAGLFVLPSLLNVIAPAPSAYAASGNPEDQLERWLYYRGMRACLQSPDFDKFGYGTDNRDISVSDLEQQGLQEHNNKEGFGYLGKDMDNDDSNDGTVSCSDGSIWVRGANLFGFGNVKNLVCAMNKAASELGDGGRIKPKPDVAPCVDNATEFHLDGGGGSIWQRMLTKALEDPISSSYGGDGDRPSFDFNKNEGKGYTYKSMLYLLGKNSLETFCGGSLASAQSDDQYKNSNRGVSVYLVNSDGTIKESGVGEAGFSHTYVITKKDNESDNVNDVYYKNGGNDNEADDRSCADMARWTREGAREYAQWLQKYGDEQDEQDGTNGNTDPSGDGEVSCAIDGIGWIICPVMRFMGDLNDKAFGYLDDLLTISPDVFSSDATRNAWGAFRDLANVAFVIAFLVIIYSQMTGAGINNYGIKKLIPKLIIAAILVNISYFVCQLAVDLSNIVGASIYNLLGSGIDIGADPEATSGGSTWNSIVVGVLAAGATILLVLVVILAPTVLLALAVVLLILVARQALVILLIVVSPLAFVAYLLPNTEDWFKKWWKAFVTILMVFPVVGLVFGASTLASDILLEASKNADPNGDDSQLLAIVALAVLGIPLFAVPALIKGSLAAAGSIGAKIGGLQDKATKSGGRKLKGRYDESALGQFNKYRQGEKTKKRALTRSGQYDGKNPLRRKLSKGFGAANASRFTGKFGDRLTAAGTSLAEKEHDEEVGRQKTALTSANMTNDQLNDIVRDKTGTTEHQAAAASLIASRSDRGAQQELFKTLHARGGDSNDGAARTVQKQVAHDMKDKPFGLGDKSLGDLQTGGYGAQRQDGSTAPSFDEEFQTRLGTKLNAESLSKLKPEETGKMLEMAEKGQLTAPQLANVKKAISDARENNLYRNNIKAEDHAKHDRILNGVHDVGEAHEQAIVQDQLYDMEHRE